MPYTGSQPDDENAPDFRSRYPASTVGMPVAMADRAVNNFSVEDASLSKVNAVARMNPLPAPGSTYATPQTDAANLSIANAMDRADLANRAIPTSIADLHTDDIAYRRDQLDYRKKVLMANLGMIPPGDAGFAAVVTPGHDKYGLAKRHEMLLELNSLEGQSRDLLHEHQIVTTAQARDAHENFVRQTHINASNDFTGLANDLADLHKNAKPGSPEFASGVLNIATRHPAGFQTQAGQTLVRGVSAMHDNATTLEDRSYWQRFGQAFKEASQTARKRGVDVQYDDQGFPSTALTAGIESDNPPERPDRPPPAAYVKQAAALAEVKARKDAAYNANPKSDLTSHDRNITLEQAKFDAMKEALGMTEASPVAAGVSPASPPATAATPAVPDLKTLAQKALNDPKASAAHKAAARKLLGQ